MAQVNARFIELNLNDFELIEGFVGQCCVTYRWLGSDCRRRPWRGWSVEIRQMLSPAVILVRPDPGPLRAFREERKPVGRRWGLQDETKRPPAPNVAGRQTPFRPV